MSAAPYTVAATIHGPNGWYDVIDSASGASVAVCPSRLNARRIAALLSDHFGCQVPAPKRRAKK